MVVLAPTRSLMPTRRLVLRSISASTSKRAPVMRRGIGSRMSRTSPGRLLRTRCTATAATTRSMVVRGMTPSSPAEASTRLSGGQATMCSSCPAIEPTTRSPTTRARILSSIREPAVPMEPRRLMALKPFALPMAICPAATSQRSPRSLLRSSRRLTTAI